MSKTEEMSDSEMWALRKKHSQEKRQSNRYSSAALIAAAGITFTSYNGGAHLVVDGNIDFWPGTGLWMVRKLSARFYGVRNLIQHVKARPKSVP